MYKSYVIIIIKCVLGIKCTIAVSSGQVLTGVMGNNLRSQICLVGSTVERAAVLVRNNPVGGIYMDQNTFIRLPYYLLGIIILSIYN